ncbi:TAXI family TRAP transporter solute-binding subunit [Brevibacillus massiliensis]|uniref:TAXI family TRAP transporter solute-binding subunit n=1 Tax=Brevibacillus massiliensis TaxID=1118054 RepID=UPI0002FA3749|nr:TAXI family TRAP transporter solute-binding subunit [Brevibacillus massiliensis]
MNKRILTLLALLLSLALVLAACGGGGTGNSQPAGESGGQQGEKQQPAQTPQASGTKQELVLGTGSTGGTYYPLGGEMANVWNKNIESVNITATATGASVENLVKIGTGELDLGMAVHKTALEAYNGEGDFKDHKVTNFGFIGHIYPEVVQILVRENSGINSIADLKGKRIAIGPGGSTTNTISKVILEAYGIKEGDYTSFSEGFGAAKDRLQDGTIDASFGILGAPASSIAELQAATKDAKLLQITGSELAAITEKTGYTEYAIPAGTYEWIKEDIHTISAFAILVGSMDKISDDLAYQLAKVMIEKADQNTHAQAVSMTKENALNGSQGLPMHPGAEKYYKEIGLLP